MAAALCGLAVNLAVAQYTPVYGPTALTPASHHINLKFQNSLRQTGVPTPISYVANPRPPATQSTDYHQQIAGPGVGAALMLAGDGNAGLAWPDPTVGIAMASPVFNFSGTRWRRDHRKTDYL